MVYGTVIYIHVNPLSLTSPVNGGLLHGLTRTFKTQLVFDFGELNHKEIGVNDHRTKNGIDILYCQGLINYMV